MRVSGQEFKQWLSRECYVATQKVPTASAIGDALSTLAGLAVHEGPERQVFTRVASFDDVVYLDLANGQVVEIRGTGWQLSTACNIRFLRHPGMFPLPVPTKTDEPLDVLFTTFLNVHDDRDLRLMMAWAVAALRGRKPFPILSVSGEQGSAKSSACRFLRRLIDPNKADTRLVPRDVRDLMIAAQNSYIIAYENLTRIDEALTNGLCCIATGASAATRALCTDTDEIMISVARPILLNGINDVATRPDLLDRTIAVTLDPIPDAARKTETEVDAAFQRAQPAILGRLLDAVACALKNEPTTRPKRLPRMADFCRTITAAEPALGWEPESFVGMLTDTRSVAVERLLEGDVVAAALLKLNLPWQGTADALRRRLMMSVPVTEVDQWPKTAKAMAHKLRDIAASLRHTGIDVVFHKGHDRTIEIRAITPTANSRPEAVEQAA